MFDVDQGRQNAMLFGFDVDRGRQNAKLIAALRSASERFGISISVPSKCGRASKRIGVCFKRRTDRVR